MRDGSTNGARALMRWARSTLIFPDKTGPWYRIPRTSGLPGHGQLASDFCEIREYAHYCLHDLCVAGEGGERVAGERRGCACRLLIQRELSGWRISFASLVNEDFGPWVLDNRAESGAPAGLSRCTGLKRSSMMPGLRRNLPATRNGAGTTADMRILKQALLTVLHRTLRTQKTVFYRPIDDFESIHGLRIGTTDRS